MLSPNSPERALTYAEGFAAPRLAFERFPFYQFHKARVTFRTLHYWGDVFCLKFMFTNEATKFSHDDTSHLTFAYIIHDFENLCFTKKEKISPLRAGKVSY